MINILVKLIAFSIFFNGAVILASFQKTSSSETRTGNDSLKIHLSRLSGAYKTAVQLNEPDKIIEIIYNMSLTLRKLGRTEEAYNVAKRGLDWKNKISDKSYYAKNLDLLNSLCRILGKYDKALSYAKEAIDIFAALKDTTGQLKSHLHLARTQKKVGNYPDALKNYLSSLSLSEQLKDSSFIVDNLTGVAVVQKYLKLTDDALSSAIRAIKIGQQIGVAEKLSDAYTIAGVVYKERNDLDKALEYFNNSLSIIQKKEDFGAIAENLNNIGHIYKRRKENGKALLNFDQALKYYRMLKDSSGVAITLNNIGEVQIILLEYKDAVNNLIAALKIASKINMKPVLLDINRNLIEAERLDGNYIESLKYYDQYTSLYKDVYNEETSKQVAQLNAKYQSELKENKIRILEKEKKLSVLKIEKETTLRNSLIIIAIILLIFSTTIFYQYKSKVKTNRLLTRINNEKEILNREISLQNEKLQRSEESLKSLNTTKDRFFSIIAHDLKNPFITIMGFSDLLFSDYAEFSDEERLFYLKEMKRTAELSHNLLQNLLQWSRSQTGRIEFHPQRLELIDLVNKNLLLIKSAAEKKQIQLQQEIPAAMAVNADEDMLHTVFRNLLTNAVKFSKQGGVISVSALSMDDFSEICVSDTGVGMDEKTMDKLFRLDVTCSTRGTANEEGTGLGLILCKEFIEKNQGKIWVESEVGRGSKFFFTLPL